VPDAERACDPVALVVPCFNEARRLDTGAFRGFASARPWLRLLFVDDGSQDSTAEILGELVGSAPEHLELLRLPANRGKAEAVRSGIQHALEAGSGSVGFWDADLATPLDELDGMRAAMVAHPSLEIVLGSRVRLLGHRIERHVWRHYFGRVAATFVSQLLTLDVYDTQCGAKLFRATPAVAHVFESPFVTRWEFDVEILARWLAYQRAREAPGVDARLLEIPLASWRDVAGSSISLRDFLRAPLDLARLWWHYAGALRAPPRPLSPRADPP
jgi:glycosyltransferase involved in cell wall biosynthesis